MAEGAAAQTLDTGWHHNSVLPCSSVGRSPLLLMYNLESHKGVPSPEAVVGAEAGTHLKGQRGILGPKTPGTIV